MTEKYAPEQFWKLYEQLSQELKSAIFSEETAESIWEICLRNSIEDERMSEIARYTGRVLLGILPPEEFQETLKKELKLEKDVAKKVTQEINRFIFYPVKPCLEELYGIEISAPAGAVKSSPAAKEKPSAGVSEEKPVISTKEEKPSAPERADRYRESIE